MDPYANSPWVEQFRPKKLEDMVGIDPYLASIEKWFAVYEKGSWPLNFQRAILLTGPPGIGKTTIARLVMQKHNYEYKEYNSADIRTAKLIESDMKKIFEFGFGSNGRPLGIIMDEVDSLTTGMKPFVAYLNPLRGKRSKSKSAQETNRRRWTPPIICICNSDKIPEDLVKDTYHVAFTIPTAADCMKLIEKHSSHTPKLEIDASTMLIKFSQHDMRRLLFILETISASFPSKQSSALTYQDIYPIIARIRSKTSDTITHADLSSITPLKVFNTNSMSSMLPLAIYDNYLEMSNNRMSSITSTIDCIAQADVLAHRLRFSPNHKSDQVSQWYPLLGVYFPLTHLTYSKTIRLSASQIIGRQNVYLRFVKQARYLDNEVSYPDYFDTSTLHLIACILFNKPPHKHFPYDFIDETMKTIRMSEKPKGYDAKKRPVRASLPPPSRFNAPLNSQDKDPCPGSFPRPCQNGYSHSQTAERA